MFFSTAIFLALGLITTSQCAPTSVLPTTSAFATGSQVTATYPATTATVLAVATYHNNTPTAVRPSHILATALPIATVNPDSRLLFGCPAFINAKWNQLGGAGGALGAPVGGQVNTPIVHQNYANGAIYCSGYLGPVYAVYGAIYIKYLQTPNFGNPTSDETGATTINGQTVRFNTFSCGGAIFWTSNTGAHLIYGDIYKEWMAIGGVKSVVGFPITDECSSGNHGGRYNDFSNGMIYWHAPHNTYVHVGGLPSTITFNWNPINFNGVPVTGDGSVVLSSNGNCHWNSNMHANSPLVYNYAIGLAVVNADGQPYTFGHKGSTGPNWGVFGGGHPDDPYDQTLNSPEVSGNWRAFVAMNDGYWQANTSLNLGTLINDLIALIKQIYPYVEAAIAVIGSP